MKCSEHRYEFAVSAAVVAMFAAFWVIGVIVASGGLPEDPKPGLGYCVQLAVGWALVATPWAVAVRLLWRAWWAGSGARLSTIDGPARLLATAVATLPEDRRDWGAAMAAELTQVQGSSARWGFAAGCVRVALFPPRSSRVPVLVVGALTAAAGVTAGLAVGHILPAMRVFAATFVGIVGAVTILAATRSHQVRAFASGPAVSAAGLAGVTACIAVTGYFQVQHPTAAVYLPPTAAVLLATVLAGCLWLALTPPRGLTTNRLARRIAVGAAMALGGGLVVASRLGLRGVVVLEEGLCAYLILAPITLVFTGSVVAAAVGRSFRAGVQAAVWTALLGSLAVYAVGLLEALVWYRFDSSLIFAGDGVPVDAVGENLRGFAWGLVLLPFLWLPFGVIGAAVGCRSRGAPTFRPHLSENLRW